MKNDGRAIWATDLSSDSVSLEEPGFSVPEKVAIVMGNETDGVSKEMLEAAEKRIYLPIHGFSESLNLGIASALVLQKLFYLCPGARGNLTEDEKEVLRKDWYSKLAKNDVQELLYTSYLERPPPILDELRRCDNFMENMSWMDKKMVRIQKRKRELELAEAQGTTKRICTNEPTANDKE